MKYALVLCAALFFSYNSQAQINQKVEITREATYIKGEDELADYIFYNLKYTDAEVAKKLRGEVSVSFYVETDSTLSSFVVLQDLGNTQCAKRIIDLLKDVKFLPTLINGHPMRAQLIMDFPIQAH